MRLFVFTIAFLLLAPKSSACNTDFSKYYVISDVGIAVKAGCRSIYYTAATVAIHNLDYAYYRFSASIGGFVTGSSFFVISKSASLPSVRESATVGVPLPPIPQSSNFSLSANSTGSARNVLIDLCYSHSSSGRSFSSRTCNIDVCELPKQKMDGFQVSYTTIPDGGTIDEDDPCYSSPILIDMEGNDFRLGPRGVGVLFDFLGKSEPVLTQWVEPGQDDAFLFLDRDGDGLVNSGQELFGNYTPLEATGVRASNGYVALAQYDQFDMGGNFDGFMTRDDAIFADLRLWLDVDADGVCRPDEVFWASDFLSKIDLVAKRNGRTDQAGNRFLFWSWVYDQDQNRRKSSDVFFKVVE